jgi:hypothetical protein
MHYLVNLEYYLIERYNTRIKLHPLYYIFNLKVPYRYILTSLKLARFVIRLRQLGCSSSKLQRKIHRKGRIKYFVTFVLTFLCILFRNKCTFNLAWHYWFGRCILYEMYRLDANTMSLFIATDASSIFLYSVGFPTTRAQFRTSRQSSSRRVIQRTILPSCTSVN